MWWISILGIVIAVVLWLTVFRLSETSRRAYTTKYRYNDDLIIWKEQDSPVNTQALRDGLTDVFIRASQQGYTEKLEFKDYTIVILKGEEYKDYWSLKVQSKGYKGSEYDNEGFVYVTDNVVDPHGFIAVAGHPLGEYDKLKQAVIQGAEHCVLYHNDYIKYKATKLHTDSGHPLF